MHAIAGACGRSAIAEEQVNRHTVGRQAAMDLDLTVDSAGSPDVMVQGTFLRAVVITFYTYPALTLYRRGTHHIGGNWPSPGSQGSRRDHPVGPARYDLAMVSETEG